MSDDKQFEDYRKVKWQHREQSYKLFMQMTKDLDNIIFASLSGSIALSITFIGDIIRNPVQDSIKWLILSWITLGLGLVFIILSYINSIKMANIEIEDIDFIFEDEIYKPETRRDPSLKDKLIYHLTTLSASMLIIGLGFMATFAVNNIILIEKVDNNFIEQSSAKEVSIIELNKNCELLKLPTNHETVMSIQSSGTVGKLLYVNNEWGLVEIGNEQGWIKESNYTVILE